MAIRLPRLPVNWKEQPALFERYYDQAMSSIEQSLNAILEIPDIQAAIQAAQDAADNANAAASNAQAAADGSAAESSIVNSYVQYGAGSPLSVDSAGNVTIATHQRVYGDPTLNPSVSVTGGSISTAAAAGSVVRIYYDDPSRSGGTVTYLFTIDPAAPPVQGGDRHSVGAVTVPATGTTPGNPVRPPGYVDAPLP